MNALCRIMLILVTFGLAGPALSQTFPNKPIRFVIGAPPGTSLDPAARLISTEMAKRLGQPILLDYKPGANSTIAAKFVINSPADGYTLYYGTVSTIHPFLNRNNGVDAAKELLPVSQLTKGPWFLIASANAPGKSFEELRSNTKPNNGASLRYGSPVQTVTLAMLMLKARTGFAPEAIPYKASNQVVIAMLAGEIDLTIGSPAPYLPHIQTGKVRALFVAASKRSSVLPNVPTAAEVGVPNFEAALNVGLWAPVGTPREVIDKLNAAAAEVLKMPTAIEEIQKFGAEAAPESPEAQMRTYEADIGFWLEAARVANYQPE